MSDTKVNLPPATVSDSKSKKKKKSKKKGGGAQQTTNGVITTQSSEQDPIQEDAIEREEVGQDDSEPEPEVDESDPVQDTITEKPDNVAEVGSHLNGTNPTSTVDDTTARFDALARDRDALKTEVTQLRQSLERLQQKHKDEFEEVQKELQDTQGEKEHAEEQYQNLLGKVNTIRSQLGERLKADAEDLAQARTRIEELEEQKSDLQEQYTARSSEIEELTTKTREQEAEIANMRSRSNLSQQNWVKERDELIESEAYIREEFENAKQAMHDWEVLAMEERSIRRDLADRVADLEEQVSTNKTEYERAAEDRDTHAANLDSLQKALQEIQDARRKELRELVETSQSEMQSLRKQLTDFQSENEKLKVDLEDTGKELSRALPFEKEVKEKNLLIGKLRHEAVILNDHLTKALRFLKKGKPEDNIDRQIVTNHLLHFLALDRSDPKKFQILQLIAALLSWTDEQREQAGLSRPGGGTGPSSSTSSTFGSLRLPGSPLVPRTPSTPSLSNMEFFSAPPPPPDAAQKESLAELWQNFLEQEATSTSTSASTRPAVRPRTESSSTAGPAPGTPKQ